MKPFFWSGTLMTLSMSLGNVGTAGAEPPNPVVVELFTSEGCSSCPPGEQTLSALLKQTGGGPGSLIVLEWHVDYWDYLGWKDRFGSAEATERQYQYARSLPSEVYTPQAVVNGTTVPSYAGDLKEMTDLIGGARQRSSSTRISLAVRPSRPDTLELEVESAGVPATAKVQAVLVEAGLSSRPTAGENAGRNLNHTQVVRRTQTLGTEGAFSFAVPSDVERSRAAIVLLVQDQRSRAILASCETALGSAVSMTSPWTGRVVDRSGTGLSRVALQACSDKVCVWGTTDEHGNFRFESLPAGRYSLTVGTKTHVTEVSLEGKAFETPRAIVVQ